MLAVAAGGIMDVAREAIDPMDRAPRGTGLAARTGAANGARTPMREMQRRGYRDRPTCASTGYVGRAHCSGDPSAPAEPRDGVGGHHSGSLLYQSRMTRDRFCARLGAGGRHARLTAQAGPDGAPSMLPGFKPLPAVVQAVPAQAPTPNEDPGGDPCHAGGSLERREPLRQHSFIGQYGGRRGRRGCRSTSRPDPVRAARADLSIRRWHTGERDTPYPIARAMSRAKGLEILTPGR